MFRSLSKLVLVLMVLFFLGSGLAFAQNGSIKGQVTDPQGKAISGAAVQLVNPEGTFQRDTKTDASGQYSITDLPPGQYLVVVTADGFEIAATDSANPLVIAAGQSLVHDQQITALKGVAESVEVKGGGQGTVELDSATISDTISSAEVTTMPLNGRNFTQLTTTTPGVSNESGQDEAKVGVAGSAKFSVNGGRVEYNTFEVDGSDVLNTGINASRGQGEPLIVYPSIDAIQDIQVLTSNYGAMYGKTASGSVIVSTKSGGAEFHGDTYAFIRNEIFNARNYFDAPGRQPLYRRQDYGFTLGGPLFIPHHYNAKKDKTFFFFSEELRLEKTPVSYNQAVPTIAERSGDFSDVCPAALVNGPASLSGYPDCPIIASGVGFPYARADVNYDAAAMLATNIIPLPNSATGCNTTNANVSELKCYVASVSPSTYWREELFRIDQNLTQKEQLSFRYIHDTWRTTTLTPQWGIVQNSFPTVENKLVGPGLDLVVNLTEQLPREFMNRVTLAYSVAHISLTPEPGPGVTSLARPAILDTPCQTVTGGNPTPPGTTQQLTECPMGYIFNNGFGGKIPGLIFQGNNGAYGGHGFSVDTGYAPWSMANPTYLIRDDASKTFGKHTIQFGIEASLVQQNELSAVSGANSGDIQGLLTFSNQQSKNSSNNAFADFLAGPGLVPLCGNLTGFQGQCSTNVPLYGGSTTAIKSYTQDSGQGRYYNRFKLAELYLQDDWRVNSRLTINAGFRASLFGNWYNEKNTAYNWEPQAYNQSVGASTHVDTTNGYLVQNTSGNPVPLSRSGSYNLGNLDPAITNGLVQCGVNGVPNSCMSSHIFNPAPRFGFAWDPTGKGRTSIRAGYGLFWEHGTSDEANTGSLIGGAPLILSETQSNPGPVRTSTPYTYSSNSPLGTVFPGGYNEIGYSCQQGAAQCQNGSAPFVAYPGGVTFPLNVTSIPTKAVYPYTQAWSLSVQRELGKDLLGTLAYVGTKGTHLTAERDLNQLPPLPDSLNPFPAGQPITNGICAAGASTGVFPAAGTSSSTSVTSSPGIGPTQAGYLNMEVACTGFPGFVNNVSGQAIGLSADTIRPYNGLSNILSIANIANSNYNGLQATMRRTKGALTLGAAYTWSHSFDDSSDRSSANFANSLNLKDNYASSDFDRRQLLSIDYIYNLPLIRLLEQFTRFSNEEEASPEGTAPNQPAKNATDWGNVPWIKTVLDKWQFSGIIAYQSGTPFSIVNAGSASGDHSYINNALVPGPLGSADNAGVGNALGIGSFADRVGNPHSVKPNVAANASTIGPLLLNPAAFAAPRGLTFGNSGRNSVNNPARTNFNMSLFKKFSVRGQDNLEFRWEVFNIFNHTQFRIYDPAHAGNTGNNVVNCYGPDYAQNSAGFLGDANYKSCVAGNSFLHPVDAHDPRIMQFGLKLAF